VHVAENHRREIPESILAAAQGQSDPIAGSSEARWRPRAVQAIEFFRQR
jgi:hypothetical protein